MEDLQKKINITVPENYNGEPIEVVIREGQAREVLPEKAPIPLNIKGTIDSVYEYLSKREEDIKVNKSMVIVNRTDVSITLKLNEDDAYKYGIIQGKLEYNEKFVEFGINQLKAWKPSDLAMFIKMNRAFFPQTDVCMKLVSDLKNYKAKVNQVIEKSMSEKGDRGDNFEQTVNSNLPEAFKIRIPIFKGKRAEEIEVETFAQVDGRDVAFVLLSPGANQVLEEIRDNCINLELEKIRALFPNLVIIEQ